MAVQTNPPVEDCANYRALGWIARKSQRPDGIDSNVGLLVRKLSPQERLRRGCHLLACGYVDRHSASPVRVTANNERVRVRVRCIVFLPRGTKPALARTASRAPLASARVRCGPTS